MRWVVMALVALVAGLSLILLALPSEAQTFDPALELRVTGAPATLVPNGAVQQIEIEWTYTFKEQTTPFLASAIGSTTLRFTPAPACEQAGIIVTGPASITIAFNSPGPDAGQTQYSGRVPFGVVATQEAPGEVPTACRFSATADAVGSQIREAAAPPVRAQFVVEYYGLLSSNVAITINEAGPQKQISYAIELTNNGNARSNVHFAIADAHSAEGWRPIAPNPILLESKNQGGTATTKTANFLVNTPYKNGWNNAEASFVLTIQPRSTLSESLQGNDVKVNVLARVRGCYTDDPAVAERLGIGKVDAPVSDGAITPEDCIAAHDGAAKSAPAGGPPLAILLMALAGLVCRRR